MKETDVLIIGAGAAGMMAAVEAGRRGRSVVLLDHNRKPGEKIRISGGGGAISPISTAKPGLSFRKPEIRFVSAFTFHAMGHDRTHGKGRDCVSRKDPGAAFCDGSAQQVVDLFVREMATAGVDLRLGVRVGEIQRTQERFRVNTDAGDFDAESLIIATGGKSIPKMGATGIGYQIAEQFGLPVEPVRAGLVPLVFGEKDLLLMKPLAGLSVMAAVSCNGVRFEEGLLFTHRGLSGPSVLQISSYWREGDQIEVDFLPGQDARQEIENLKRSRGGQIVDNALSAFLPKKLVALIVPEPLRRRRLADLRDKDLSEISDQLKAWRIKPTGSEGFRTAEVTLGGVSTDALASRTMQARSVPGLFFVGEVVDVTGWLGGYNFQWAWSSGWAAGQVA